MAKPDYAISICRFPINSLFQAATPNTNERAAISTDIEADIEVITLAMFIYSEYTKIDSSFWSKSEVAIDLLYGEFEVDAF